MTSNVDGAIAPGRSGVVARQGVSATDLLLLLMVLIWGINFSVVKYGTSVIHPFAFNALRLALAAAVVIVAARGERLPSLERRDRWSLAALGLLGNGLYQLLFIAGIARTRAGNAAVILAAVPAIVAIIGRVRGTERTGRRAVAGIVLSMAGIALIVFTRDEGSRGAGAGEATLLGNLLVLAGAVCWAFYTVLMQPFTTRISALQSSAVVSTAGAIPLLIVAAPALASTSWVDIPTRAWLAILYSGVGALAIAQLIWYRGVRVLGPTRTSMYANLQPLAALLVAWLALGERPTPLQALGAATIIAGVIMTRQ